MRIDEAKEILTAALARLYSKQDYADIGAANAIETFVAVAIDAKLAGRTTGESPPASPVAELPDVLPKGARSKSGTDMSGWKKMTQPATWEEPNGGGGLTANEIDRSSLPSGAEGKAIPWRREYSHYLSVSVYRPGEVSYFIKGDDAASLSPEEAAWLASNLTDAAFIAAGTAPLRAREIRPPNPEPASEGAWPTVEEWEALEGCIERWPGSTPPGIEKSARDAFRKLNALAALKPEPAAAGGKTDEDGPRRMYEHCASLMPYNIPPWVSVAGGMPELPGPSKMWWTAAYRFAYNAGRADERQRVVELEDVRSKLLETNESLQAQAEQLLEERNEARATVEAWRPVMVAVIAECARGDRTMEEATALSDATEVAVDALAPERRP